MPKIAHTCYSKSYYAPCCSQACCVWFCCYVAVLMIPLAMTFSSNSKAAPQPKISVDVFMQALHEYTQPIMTYR